LFRVYVMSLISLQLDKFKTDDLEDLSKLKNLENCPHDIAEFVSHLPKILELCLSKQSRLVFELLEDLELENIKKLRLILKIYANCKSSCTEDAQKKALSLIWLAVNIKFDSNNHKHLQNTSMLDCKTYATYLFESVTLDASDFNMLSWNDKIIANLK